MPDRLSEQRILVVDDEVFVRELLEEYFGRLGFEVTAAESGDAGIEAAQSTGFGVALVDLKMPALIADYTTDNCPRFIDNVNFAGQQAPYVNISGHFKGDKPPVRDTTDNKADLIHVRKDTDPVSIAWSCLRNQIAQGIFHEFLGTCLDFFNDQVLY